MKELQPLPEPQDHRNEGFPESLMSLNADQMEDRKKINEIIPIIVLLLQERSMAEHIQNGD